MDNTPYRPPWDSLAIWITVIFSSGLLLVMVSLFLFGDTRWSSPQVLIFLLPFFAIFSFPISAEKVGGKVRLRFLIHTRTLDPSLYRRVQDIAPYRIQPSMRIFASGGFFGYAGIWYSFDSRKRFTSFLTHRSRDVVVLSRDGKVIVLNLAPHLADLFT